MTDFIDVYTTWWWTHMATKHPLSHSLSSSSLSPYHAGPLHATKLPSLPPRAIGRLPFTAANPSPLSLLPATFAAGTPPLPPSVKWQSRQWRSGGQGGGGATDEAMTQWLMGGGRCDGRGGVAVPTGRWTMRRLRRRRGSRRGSGMVSVGQWTQTRRPLPSLIPSPCSLRRMPRSSPSLPATGSRRPRSSGVVSRLRSSRVAFGSGFGTGEELDADFMELAHVGPPWQTTPA